MKAGPGGACPHVCSVQGARLNEQGRGGGRRGLRDRAGVVGARLHRAMSGNLNGLAFILRAVGAIEGYRAGGSSMIRCTVEGAGGQLGGCHNCCSERDE